MNVRSRALIYRHLLCNSSYFQASPVFVRTLIPVNTCTKESYVVVLFLLTARNVPTHE
jgi:hypothetical protein